MIPTALKLTAEFRIYVPDLPGFGDSGKPQKILDVPALADWLADWMTAIGGITTRQFIRLPSYSRSRRAISRSSRARDSTGTDNAA